LLFVSHDRRFIERVADRLLLIQDRQIIQFDGNYAAYLAKQQRKQTQLEREEQIMRLEHRLSQVLGKLCLLTKEDERAALDAEYQAILRELQYLKGLPGK